jgi:phosphohistidine phosphatase
MKLYCVRHGEAVDGFEDPERPLTPQGREDVRKLAQLLLDQGLRIPHMIHSPRLRARQTAEIFAEAVQPQRITESKTGLDENDSPETMAEDIQHWQDDTILVGHMPFMSRLISELMIGESSQHLVDFVPGSIICLENYGDKMWLIKWLLVPELVRASY